MMTLTFSYPSAVLGRPVPVRAALPLTGPEESLPALYLLHGVNGGEHSIFDFTRAAFWARKYRIAVFCPAGENSFYLPRENGDYLRLIGEELPDVTRRMFPLSKKREDTALGGISMGGYGALNAAYRYPGTFGAAVALSAALEPWRIPALKAYLPAGDEPLDTLSLARQCARPAPKVWLTCGLEDELLQVNRDFARNAAALGLPVCLEERPGGHTWDFWNEALERAMLLLTQSM